MEDTADIKRIASNVLDSINNLMEVKKAAEEYSSDPSDQNAEKLVQAFGNLSFHQENLQLQLTAMIKNIQEPESDGGKYIVAQQTSNGIKLS